MARSDTEEYCPSAGIMGVTSMSEGISTNDSNAELLNAKTIHSGHFMVSCVHDRELEDDDDSDSDNPAGRPSEVPDQQGFDFQNAAHEPQKSYDFGPTSSFNKSKYAIDTSLSTLFNCMTLAYSGKLTSPKWKNFKGIKLKLKDKIRLNNIIWREWHMQYIHGQKPIVCHFDPPISDKQHAKPESVVLEGKYWKRRLESVTAEYQKWRLFFKHQPGMELNQSEMGTKSLEKLLQQVAESYSQRAPWQLASTKLPSSLYDPLQTEDDDIMDFSDTLFTTLNQQNFAFPTPREMYGLGNADFMQPGLVQLQPNFDDFMDTIDMADMLSCTMSRTEPTTSNVFGLNASSSSTTSPSTSSTLGLFSRNILPGTSTMAVDEPVDLNAAINSGLFEEADPLLDVQQPPASPAIAETPPQPMSPAVTVVPMQQSDTQTSQQPGAQNLNYQTSQIIRLILQQHQQAPLEISPTQPHDNRAPQQSPQPAHLTQLPQTQLQHQTQIQQQLQHQTQLPQHTQLQQQHTPLQQQHTQLQPHTQLQQTQQQQLQLQQQKQIQQLHQSQLQQALLQQAQLQQPQFQQIPMQQQQQQQQQPQSLLPKPQTVHLGTVVGHAQPVTTQPPTMVTTPQTVTIIQNSSQLHSLLQSLNSQAAAPAQPVADTVGRVYNQAPVTGRQVVLSENTDSSKDSARRASTGSLNMLSRSITRARKEGDFLVPQKPGVRTKQRNLAPAPPPGKTQTSSPIVQQNTFLAQLLTGRHPSIAAPASVKREDQPKVGAAAAVAALPQTTAQASFMTIQPAINSVTTPTQHTFPVSAVALSDLKKSVLMPTAGQAPAAVCDSLSSVPSNSPSHNNNSAPGSPASPCNSFNASSPSYSVPSPGSDTAASSPGKPHRVKNDGERHVYRENRRVSHITAEQKRRYNIKEGFDTLHQLVPSLKCNPNSKISKAATLSKTAEFCRKLKEERAARQQQTELLRQEIEALNNDISFCQQQLPATGAPVTRQRADQMRDMFDDYVRTRTLQNWKFWIFSIIIRPLFESYNNMVSTASVDDLCRTVLAWLEQHCSLVALRPGVLNSLCHLSTTTSILSDPDRVAEQATRAVLKKQQKNDTS